MSSISDAGNRVNQSVTQSDHLAELRDLIRGGAHWVIVTGSRRAAGEIRWRASVADIPVTGDVEVEHVTTSTGERTTVRLMLVEKRIASHSAVAALLHGIAHPDDVSADSERDIIALGDDGAFLAGLVSEIVREGRHHG
jgi:hypothetical protein